MPDSLARWVKTKFSTLGTYGFGRSEGRSYLRDFFEVDAKHIVMATLASLAEEGQLTRKGVAKAQADLGISANKPNPFDELDI